MDAATVLRIVWRSRLRAIIWLLGLCTVVAFITHGTACVDQSATDRNDASTPRYLGVSAGTWHNCALDAAGKIVCWARGNVLAEVPGGTFHSVDVRGWRACGLREDDVVVCWNFSTDRQQPQEWQGHYAAIAVGGSHICAVRRDDGNITCRGGDYRDQLDVPTNGPYESISAFDFHSCAVRRDSGIVDCWGDPLSGAKYVRAGLSASVIDVGSNHACAIRSLDRRIECWGVNSAGQLTLPETALTERFSDVATGSLHTCAIRQRDEIVICWGDSTFNQLDAPLGRASAVSAGDNHTCALWKDGSFDCWGDRQADITAAPMGRYTAVAVGDNFACALSERTREVTGNNVICWGDIQQQPALSQGTYTEIDTNVKSSKHAQGSAAKQYACALNATSGDVHCWGQEGGETYAHTSYHWPYRYMAISVGSTVGCAVTVAGGVDCWTLNNDLLSNALRSRIATEGALLLFRNAQRGEEPFQIVATKSGALLTSDDEAFDNAKATLADDPIRMYSPEGRPTIDPSPPRGDQWYMTVAVGSWHACRMDNRGAVDCWEWNPVPSTYTKNTVAVPQEQDEPYGAIAVGPGHSCGLRQDDGAIICWGNNLRVDRVDDTRYIAVDVGSQHTCAIRELDRRMHCWGNNDDRQLDAIDARYIAVSAGLDTSCGITEELRIHCWGNEGTGTTEAPVLPSRLDMLMKNAELLARRRRGQVMVRQLQNGTLLFGFRIVDDNEFVPLQRRAMSLTRRMTWWHSGAVGTREETWGPSGPAVQRMAALTVTS